MLQREDLLFEKWRVEARLTNLQKIQRWLIWDVQQKQHFELLSPTPTERLSSQQPTHFSDLHSSQSNCIFSGLHAGIPVAIYPLPQGELDLSKRLGTLDWETILHHIHLDISDNESMLFPEEIIQMDHTVMIRRLGQVFTKKRIGVNPLQHPSEAQHSTFSLAMMIILNQTSGLSWKTDAEFSKWIQQVAPETLLPNMSELVQQWVGSTLLNIKPSLIPESTHVVSLPNIELDSIPAQSNKTLSTSISASAKRDIPMPRYLLVVEYLSSKSTAKELSAVAGVPPNAILDQMSETGPIIIGGSDSETKAQEMLEQFENFSINTNVIHRDGNFTTATLFGSSAVVFRITHASNPRDAG